MCPHQRNSPLRGLTGSFNNHWVVPNGGLWLFPETTTAEPSCGQWHQGWAADGGVCGGIVVSSTHQKVQAGLQTFLPSLPALSVLYYKSTSHIHLKLLFQPVASPERKDSVHVRPSMKGVV